MGWIRWRLEKATFRSFAIWFALAFAFSYLAFYRSSPWTRALDAAGGQLPESQRGSPPGEPALSLGKLGSATNDYILWQALDIPWALIILMTTSTGIALALKKTRLATTPLRFLLFLPMVYVGCEIVENTLVALFALGALPMEGTAVAVQQAATTAKFWSGEPSGILGVAGAALALVISLLAHVFGKKK